VPNRVAELRELLRASAEESRTPETWLVMLEAEVAMSARCLAGRHIAPTEHDRQLAAAGARRALGLAAAVATEALTALEAETGLAGPIAPEVLAR
jgi:hypothetical protein